MGTDGGRAELLEATAATPTGDPGRRKDWLRVQIICLSGRLLRFLISYE